MIAFVVLSIILRIIIAGGALYGLLISASLTYDRGPLSWVYTGIAVLCLIVFWVVLLVPWT